MDSLTHVLLGGLIGNAVLARRAGNKAVLWGALVATVPDVDVPLGQFMSDLEQLSFHRGITHSLLFAAILAPLAGLLLDRLYRRDGIGWRRWALLCGLVLFSHLLLDLFTSYGIQLLQPFSDTAYSVASISVIDPLFTLPLLLALPVVLFLRRARAARQWLGYLAVSLSALYLSLTVVNKTRVERVFVHELARQQVEAQRLFVKPTLFNNVLWRGVVETEDEYLVGFRSLLDRRQRIRFLSFPKNHQLLSGLEDSEAVRRLVWVSNGFYMVERREDGLYVHDLRYGKGFEFMTVPRDFVFSYRLLLSDDRQGVRGIKTVEPQLDRSRDRASLGELLRRIRGLD